MKTINLMVAVALVAMIGMVGFVSAQAGDAVDLKAFGTVEFQILAGAPADSTIYVMNDKQGLTFDARFNPDHTPVAGQDNSKFLKVKVLADGKSEPVTFANGQFTAYLAQGNGDQMEVQHFTAAGTDGQAQRVVFLGAARPSDPRIVGVGMPLVIVGAYGFAHQYDVTLIDTPAYDEVVVDVPEHTHYFGDYAKVGSGPGTRYEYVGHNMGDYDVDFDGHFLSNYDYDFVKWHITYVGHHNGHFSVDDVNYEGHVTHAAVTHTVHHDAVTHESTVVDGTVVDVTAEVREAVAAGHFKFQFNNAMNPGGIVSPDGTTVYVQIADPAFGFVKTVEIQFVGGFNPAVQTVNAQEYEVINLGL